MNDKRRSLDDENLRPSCPRCGGRLPTDVLGRTAEVHTVEDCIRALADRLKILEPGNR